MKSYNTLPPQEVFSYDILVAIEDTSVILSFSLTYIPGAPGMRTLRNGDPGYQDDPPEINIKSIKKDGTDIPSWMFQELCESDVLANRLINRHEDMLQRNRRGEGT